MANISCCGSIKTPDTTWKDRYENICSIPDENFPEFYSCESCEKYIRSIDYV